MQGVEVVELADDIFMAEPTPVVRDDVPQPVPELVEDFPADFTFDIDAPGTEATADEPPAIDQPSLDTPVEIDGIDFGSLAAVAGPATEPDVPVEAAMGSLDDFEVPELESEPQPEEVPEPPALEEPAEESLDEQVKVIGSLRIGIPLYNVYLNEADEWSRRLQQDLSEWALAQLPSARSCGGPGPCPGGQFSYTVGFHALSDVARALEASPQHAGALPAARRTTARLSWTLPRKSGGCCTSSPPVPQGR